MTKAFIFSAKTPKATICLLLLAIIFSYAYSARILDEVESQPQVVNDTPQPSNPTVKTVSPTTTLPSGQMPAVAPTATVDDDDEEDVDPVPVPETNPSPILAPPVADVAPVAVTPVVASPAADVAPMPNPATTIPSGPAPVAATSTTVAANSADPHDPVLSFFMHDILGGSHPSARVVTGIVASTEINGIPFSKTNNNIFPVNGGNPLVNLNNINKLINPNNVPFLTGLNGNNIAVNGNNQPFVTAGQLPSGSTLQRLMFGSITVIDDELTEGHELGSAVIGKAQAFYLSSSLDGTSQTIALTIFLHSGDHDIEDAISFFGVHRTVSHESNIAVIGGTGKYENSKGYATVETLHQEDQHITDGVDTILQLNVYLTQ